MVFRDFLKENRMQAGMKKEDLTEKPKSLPGAYDDMSFSMKLEIEELKILVA